MSSRSKEAVVSGDNICLRPSLVLQIGDGMENGAKQKWPTKRILNLLNGFSTDLSRFSLASIHWRNASQANTDSPSGRKESSIPEMACLGSAKPWTKSPAAHAHLDVPYSNKTSRKVPKSVCRGNHSMVRAPRVGLRPAAMSAAVSTRHFG